MATSWWFGTKKITTTTERTVEEGEVDHVVLSTAFHSHLKVATKTVELERERQSSPAIGLRLYTLDYCFTDG